ncbi:MAG: bifunctional diguanylate cyclase/phosphodiesterase [Nitratireductor sp.]|nr:bifunctional diguanylate cyclase/phosphodiesterase [Nitratireductor sp.]
MSVNPPDRQANQQVARLGRSVRLTFVVVSLAVGIVCVVAWADLVPQRYAGLADILAGLAGIAGITFLYLRVGPALGKLPGIALAGNPAQSGQAVHGVGGGNEVARRSKDDGNPALALTDPLTGLGNRSRMIEKFARMVDGRSDQAPFAVGLMNIDGMKPVNQNYGTVAGDEVLQQCAQRLAAAIEGNGIVCRYAGDVFGFIFPDVKEPREAEETGRLLQNVLLAPFRVDGRTVRLTGSFGLAFHHPRVGDFKQVIARAETALQHSKQRGRGRVTLYSEEIEQLVNEGARLEKALREAIANQDVKPYYQPIISLQDGRLLGFEALARWIDPELGTVPPSRFITLAEERGLIVPLTESLLAQAVATAADWPDELFLSFNISGLLLIDFATAEHIKEAAYRAGLPLHRLEIEVTESAIMSDPDTAARIIGDLHQAGIRASMDDFGTGQSSLGRLRQLQLDKVKIDRSFVMTIGEDKTAEHIVRAILEMCEGLGMTVVAEGIEELDQAETLRRYGCHAGQGYLFGKPRDCHHTMNYIRDFLTYTASNARSGVA